MLKLNMLTPNI